MRQTLNAIAAVLDLRDETLKLGASSGW
jgi:hypothetical protein